jgi:hypothetical protein
MANLAVRVEPDRVTAAFYDFENGAFLDEMTVDKPLSR